MATTSNLSSIIRYYAEKQKSPFIDLKEFCAYVKKYAEHHVEEQSELVKYLGDPSGTVVAELTVTLIQMYFTRKDFDYRQLLKLSWKYLFASLIMYVICFIIGTFITRNIISVVVQVAVGSIVYGSCLLIMRDKFVFEVIGRILHKADVNK